MPIFFCYYYDRKDMTCNESKGIDYVTQMKLYNLIFWMVFLIVRYINKMVTDGGGGVLDGRHSNDCKHDIGPRLKSQPGYNFFANFCTNSYKQIHTIIIQIVCTNSYTV